MAEEEIVQQVQLNEVVQKRDTKSRRAVLQNLQNDFISEQKSENKKTNQKKVTDTNFTKVNSNSDDEIPEDVLRALLDL